MYNTLIQAGYIVTKEKNLKFVHPDEFNFYHFKEYRFGIPGIKYYTNPNMEADIIELCLRYNNNKPDTIILKYYSSIQNNLVHNQHFLSSKEFDNYEEIYLKVLKIVTKFPRLIKKQAIKRKIKQIEKEFN